MKQPFPQHFPVGADGFYACRLQVGQILAFRVTAEFTIGFPDVEEISGHLFGSIGFLKNQRPEKPGVPVPISVRLFFPMELAARNRPRV